MKIYTKTGDKGETSLFTGQRLPKSDQVFEALGTVDECNCNIGLAIAELPEDTKFENLRKQLTTIQHTLFDLGAALATPQTKASNSKLNKTRFDHDGIELLEKWIDAMEEHLPTLKNFILPGGHACGATLHMARSVCRRAERFVTPINDHADVSDNVLIYLNRLSDYLFIASRYANMLMGSPETPWKPHKHSQEA